MKEKRCRAQFRQHYMDEVTDRTVGQDKAKYTCLLQTALQPLREITLKRPLSCISHYNIVMPVNIGSPPSFKKYKHQLGQEVLKSNAASEGCGVNTCSAVICPTQTHPHKNLADQITANLQTSD